MFTAWVQRGIKLFQLKSIVFAILRQGAKNRLIIGNDKNTRTLKTTFWELY